MTTRSRRIWFTTAQAAEYAEKHPGTIRRSLEAGDLHGSQRLSRGHWRIHVDCLDAWLLGEHCSHQQAGAA